MAPLQVAHRRTPPAPGLRPEHKLLPEPERATEQAADSRRAIEPAVDSGWATEPAVDSRRTIEQVVDLAASTQALVESPVEAPDSETPGDTPATEREAGSVAATRPLPVLLDGLPGTFDWSQTIALAPRIEQWVWRLVDSRLVAGRLYAAR